MKESSFKKVGAIDEARYDAITRVMAKAVPSSILSCNDRPCTLEIKELVEISYGDKDEESYAAFICCDKKNSYLCHLPIFFVKKVFNGYAVDGSLTVGKCVGTYVDLLENGAYSWETVSKLIGKQIRVHDVVKIISESRGKKVHHRVYTIDLV